MNGSVVRRPESVVRIRLDVFGRRVLAERTGTGWKAYYVGQEGKRRAASDITIPSEIAESDLERYLADLCHEWATERHPAVTRIG